MSKNALIVGFPRSGTSMTTNIFVKQGYFTTNDKNSELRTGDRFNPSGYFEANSLIEANVEVFKQVGYENHNTWLFDEISNQQASNINEQKLQEEHKTLINDYNKNTPWVWKDPRLCYTLGYWWKGVDTSNTVVLLLTRNSKDIFRSFTRLMWRNKTEDDKNELESRINHHISFAKNTIKQFNIPHIEIDYKEIANKPMEIIKMLNLKFDLDLTPSDLGFKKSLNHRGFRGDFLIFKEIFKRKHMLNIIRKLFKKNKSN